MYRGKRIGVVVPAYNEERFIAKVLDTMPAFVDRIYVVDDASRDATFQIASQRAEKDPRIEVSRRENNGGVGAAIITGHRHALCDGMEVVSIMAGDNQMPPAVLPRLLNPVVEGRADYAKGDRTSTSADQKEMPRFRRFGTFLLTILTRIAAGYWHLNDPQNGYTAISREALLKLHLESIHRGFTFENDMLVRLNLIGAKVVDVPHEAVYRGQKSKLNYPEFIVKTSWMLMTSWIWRLARKIPLKANSKNSNHEASAVEYT